MERTTAKRWRISGRVQGVGFRYFVQREASRLNLNGWVRNLADGSVEVYAAGARDRLDKLAAALRSGPPLAEVTHVEESAAPPEALSGFSVR
jgi:acylphosphatase